MHTVSIDVYVSELQIDLWIEFELSGLKYYIYYPRDARTLLLASTPPDTKRLQFFYRPTRMEPTLFMMFG